ncbi:MAG: metal ABC transporter substrate-binding protein [Candidatus Hydrogenedentes bacterium]|nr:metal ABC transporter substrate-binding protein [Candidatus Hydrogenedentota bacterium]
MSRKSIARIASVAAILALLTAFPLTLGCGGAPAGNPTLATTIPPIALVLRELASPRTEVVTLLSPGVSAHTYEITPADARAVGSALALFYVDDALDGWAARLPARMKVRLFEWVPADARIVFSGTHVEEDGHDHEHGDFDPHFWSDPTVVKATLPKLADKLAELDPEGAELYRANAKRFAEELDTLDQRVSEKLKPVKGRAIVTFHPSWDYYLKRYGIRNVGVLEPSPGKEASPQQIMNLVETIRAAGVTAVFSEPQLPSRPAEVLADTADVKLGMLDPYGGVPGRTTYRELIEFNTDALLEMLQ